MGLDPWGGTHGMGSVDPGSYGSPGSHAGQSGHLSVNQLMDIDFKLGLYGDSVEKISLGSAGV